MAHEGEVSFKEIFEGSSEGIIIVNKSGIILEANPASSQIFQYGANELVGKQIESLLPTKLRDRHAQHREGFHQHPTPRNMGVGRDLMALRKDGSEFPVEVSLSHTESNGRFLIMAFIIDITKRKKVENALKQSEEQLIVYATELEKKVEARTDALKDTVSKLEWEILERKKAEEEVRKLLIRERELNDLKSKFISIASHEFRTPLSTILSSTSLINQYKINGDLDKQEKHIVRIKSSVNHLTGILNDFLSLGKLEEGKLEVKKELIPLKRFLQEVVDEIQVTLKEEQEILIQLNDGEALFHSDIQIMRNILFNLLSNASKYSEPKTTIYLDCTVDSKRFNLSIRDTGMGIPSEEVKYLFDRFFRASNASNIQGTGLGLHIVKRYVELLEGTLTFESTIGKGSTFSISLPH